MREWMTEIIQRYWINEKKLEELDKEMGACKRKQQFWDSHIEYLNSIDRSATSYDIEVTLEGHGFESKTGDSYRWVWEYDEYLNGFWMDSVSGDKSDADSPGGLVVLAGFSLGDKPVSLNLEARYVMLAKGKLVVNCHSWATEADFSGLQLSLLAGITFR